MNTQPLTFSGMKMFLNCRKKYFWRHKMKLVPLKETEALYFGSLMHKCWESWHTFYNKKTVRELILDNAKEIDMQIRAESLMEGYWHKHPAGQGTWEPKGYEIKIEAPIINPATNRPSKMWHFAGKVDGIVKINGEWWVLEHKTTSTYNATYIEAMWIDLQSQLYQIHAARALGIDIVGTLYNVAEKSKCRQKKTETQQGFKDRLTLLYRENDVFHRTKLVFTKESLQATMKDLWDTAYAIPDTDEGWLRNPSECNRIAQNQCPYFKLCHARECDQVGIAATLYQIKEPNNEITDSENPTGE